MLFPISKKARIMPVVFVVPWGDGSYLELKSGTYYLPIPYVMYQAA